MTAVAQRNENVAVYLIDTNAVKESNIRVGITPSFVSEANVEAQHFGREFGLSSSEILTIRPQPPLSGIHGEASWQHQNSVFNARTFFQVGPVKPSHRNSWNARLTAPVRSLGDLTLGFTQRDIRAVVNGNVLVPLPSERTPKTTDTEARAIVQSFLDAYPLEEPNRPDFDVRALNTNSPQRIDSILGTGRLDRTITSKHKLLLSYAIDRQRIRAFQLVAGQNPDTELHAHRARIGWAWNPDARTTALFTASFSRLKSVLVSEPNAVGPRVRMGFQIEELGPDSMFPIDRASNTYRYGALMQRLLNGGRHELIAGGDIIRFQLNGIESGNLRGYFQFTNNFGRSAIENLLLGTPSSYEVALGDLARGYRNWSFNGYVADRWRVNPRLQIYLGVRWFADTRPVEVDDLDQIPYDTDANNFSPRLSFAWQAGRAWTVRGMYTTTFGQLLPVAYQQVRNNPPRVTYVQVNDPDLVDPLAGIDLSDPNARYSPTWLSKDLSTPYSHQYNLTFERRFFWNSLLRAGYVGSRSFKLLNSFIENRALPVPGIPLTTATVNIRRPDPRYYETRSVVNGGIAWFDAASLSLDLPVRRGFGGSIAYYFSKALDEGADFSATAANKDLISQRSQSMYDSYPDRKGLSNYHSPHALQFSYSWDVPVPAGMSSLARAFLSGWQIGGVNMWKTGMPFTLFIGSDAPGFGNVDGSPSDRPNILDPSILGGTASHPTTVTGLIRRDRFSFIRPGDLRGSLGRNTFAKATIWNWNAAIQKLLRFSNDWTLQIRGEAYNLSNTPQFDEPQRNLSSPSFGKITNALNDGRVIQLGVRLVL